MKKTITNCFLNAKYFHINDHIYLAKIEDKVVLLDLCKNQYILISKLIFQSIYFSINNQFEIKSGKYIPTSIKDKLPEKFDECINILLQSNVLKFGYSNPCLKRVDGTSSSVNATEIDWQAPRQSCPARKTELNLVLSAYFILIKIFFLLKIKGFHALIKFLIKNKPSVSIKKKPEDFELLIEALNKACFWFPIEVKCLEWSSALVIMGLKRRWECNIEIGIQIQPFLAHAWVVVCGKILSEKFDRQNTMTAILSEPFRSTLCF